MVRLAALVLVCVLALTGAARADLQGQYERFLEDTMWPKARSAGVSRATFDGAMGTKRLNTDIPGLVRPGQTTPQRIRQAEFSAPARYFNENNLGAIVSQGRRLASQHASTLAALERRYGVPGRIILAIWGRESAFGRVDIPHDAFQVLGTKAFMSTRPELFRTELVAALQMVERGNATPAQMKSSWAGALGQPQFLPTSFLEHAVDIDGDGKPNIWTSVPDTLGSIAAYLDHFGWVSGRDWGFEVSVPADISCSFEGPDQGLKIRDWAAMGITRISGRPFPAHEMDLEAYLMMPAGRSGPAFIVTPNFYVLKQYNESDLYALFVGHAGDRIEWGSGRFKAAWGRVDTLYRSEIAAMQRVLEGKGYDVGGADGLPGFKTRRSIGDWQQKNGRQPTCFPSKALIGAIR
ncbi:MAG: lytic murein transglycosylase [Roseitalea sp.]|uniref:lytic murein transglycosylase n=1 Tax=Oceaniradius stylonematis TaxID=2184161 RepID=UPI000F3E1DF8|nr:lytic murein transglycosylase [Oceaniradius stylonematis]MBO6553385.1 lytic murein transglycosylase [Roseitalea sp.]MBO6952428.1 lytic murein transglycosylase [Rhizobiaceae bacterium]RNC91332.1 MAG: lytic murein transglycosylase [Oricola sp.]MBO6593086.1 lytic murein transglycosylase [Roseitalea sp.]MBO6600172.1 lytic murein transglycosylase [Roseitalea sp.]